LQPHGREPDRRPRIACTWSAFPGPDPGVWSTSGSGMRFPFPCQAILTASRSEKNGIGPGVPRQMGGGPARDRSRSRFFVGQRPVARRECSGSSCRPLPPGRSVRPIDPPRNRRNPRQNATPFPMNAHAAPGCGPGTPFTSERQAAHGQPIAGRPGSWSARAGRPPRNPQPRTLLRLPRRREDRSAGWRIKPGPGVSLTILLHSHDVIEMGVCCQPHGPESQAPRRRCDERNRFGPLQPGSMMIASPRDRVGRGCSSSRQRPPLVRPMTLIPLPPDAP